MNRVRKPGRPAGMTLMEVLIAVAVVVALAAIAIPVMSSMKQRANRARTLEKLRSLGIAMISYTDDHNGALPWEDAPGSDDWQAVADPANSDVWYNALPALMNHPPASELAHRPELFYDESYPLCVPGAPYPSGDKKLGSPLFALAMNSRLQRKDDSGVKERGTLLRIRVPQRTVIFLERGLAGDKKSNPGQRGFSGSPKANPRAFVGRHNGKGLLLFADGHAEMYAVSDLITTSGHIIYPQVDVVWTCDPDDDPN